LTISVVPSYLPPAFLICENNERVEASTSLVEKDGDYNVWAVSSRPLEDPITMAPVLDPSLSWSKITSERGKHSPLAVNIINFLSENFYFCSAQFLA